MDLETRQLVTSAAVSALAEGDFAKASENAIKLVADDPSSPDGHRAWGHVLLDQKQFGDAVASFRTAARLDPSRPVIYFELSSALIAQAERMNHRNRASVWTEARDIARSGLTLDPHSSIGQALIDLAEERRLVDSLENGEKVGAPRRRRRSKSTARLRLIRS